MAQFKMNPNFEKELTKALNAPNSPIKQQADAAIQAVARRVRDSHPADETADQVYQRLITEATKDKIQPEHSKMREIAQHIVDGTLGG